MASLAALLAWPDHRLVVLAEATPSLELGGWTSSAPTYPNTYQISVPALAHANRYPGGLYRRVIGLRENSTDLTARTSAALVDANPSSWFWDEAAGILYARSSTGSDPDTFTVYHALVTFYFATEGVVLDRVDGDPSTGIYYLPWLTGDLPTWTQEAENMFFGAKLSEVGQVSFANGHAAWHDMIPGYSWKNKRVRFFLGGSYNAQALLRSQYTALTTMLVEDLAADEEQCVLMLKPLPRLLEAELPRTPWIAGSLGDGVKGTKKWLGWGRATVRPDLSDTTVSAGKWTIADPAYQTLFAVHQVWAVEKNTGVRTVLALGTDYTEDLTACTVTIVRALSTPGAPAITPRGTTGSTTYSYRIAARSGAGTTLASAQGQTTTGNATLNHTNFNAVAWNSVAGAVSYDVYGRTAGSEQLLANVPAQPLPAGFPMVWEDTGGVTPSGAVPGANTAWLYPYTSHDVEVDVTGKPDGAGGYLKTFGQVVKDILQTHLAVATADLDTASFAQADIDAPQELSVWLKPPRSIASILSTAEPELPGLERSVLGTLLYTLDGKWFVQIFDPGYDPTPLTSLRKQDFARFSPEPRLESVFSKTEVYYAYDHARQEWLVEEKADARVEHLAETKEPLPVHTFLRSAGAAQTLAQRAQFLLGSGSVEIEFELRQPLLAQHKALDKVLVTYDPAPFAGGKVENKAFELLRITGELGPTLVVSGRLGDLKGVGGRIGRWAPSSAGPYSSAPSSERDQYAYWADSSGFIVPGDAATRDIRLWW